MRKCWFFGDSFTAGYGATKDFPYYKAYGPGFTFSSLLSSYYQCKEYNFGLPGECNNAIIKTIISKLPLISKNDIVVISNTSPLRDLVPHKSKPQLISQKLFDSNSYTNSLGYNSKDISETLIEYCIKIKEPYIPEWNYHYRSMFINLVNFFISIGCKSIFWDYSVWSEEEYEGMKFENINQATNGKIYDLHWSYKGHKEAYEWILEGLETKKKFIK